MFVVDVCKSCDPYAKCINNTCICNPGYKGDGFHCERKWSGVRLWVNPDEPDEEGPESEPECGAN